jgi:hypothetical protein
MDTELTELDGLQAEYTAAVDTWVTAIRAEEALASVPHSVAELDKWEGASFHQEELGDKVKAAKATYENGLREKFFQF